MKVEDVRSFEEQLVEEIEDYCRRTAMASSSFGLQGKVTPPSSKPPST